MSFRFWIPSANGTPVRVSLAAGETLVVSGGGPDEEGFHWWGSRYSVDGDHIVEEHGSRSRDCDGYYSHSSTYRVRVDSLGHYPRKCHDELHRRMWFMEDAARPVTWPQWERVDEFNRDHSAEAAGY